jgi:hypothetical protein
MNIQQNGLGLLELSACGQSSTACEHRCSLPTRTRPAKRGSTRSSVKLSATSSASASVISIKLASSMCVSTTNIGRTTGSATRRFPLRHTARRRKPSHEQHRRSSAFAASVFSVACSGTADAPRRSAVSGDSRAVEEQLSQWHSAPCSTATVHEQFNAVTSSPPTASSAIPRINSTTSRHSGTALLDPRDVGVHPRGSRWRPASMSPLRNPACGPCPG